MVNSRDAIVKILTEVPGVLALSINGVLTPVQAIEVEILETAGTVARLVIVHAYFPPMPASECEEIAQKLRPHFLNTNLFFVVRDRKGEAEVYVPTDQEQSDAFPVAAAVAVIKASWGWEDAKQMLIKVGGEPVRINLEVVNQSWIAGMANAGHCCTNNEG